MRKINLIGLVSIMLIISGYFSIIEAVSVTPSIIKLSAPPGESKGNVFRLYNGGEREIYVTVSMKDWVLVNNTRKFAQVGSCSRTLSNWITFEEETFTIPPKKDKTVRFMIDVPPDAEGGYWGLAFFNARPLRKERGGGIQIATQVVAFIGLEVEGTLKRKVRIMQVEAEHVKDRGVRLRAQLKNTGNLPLFQPSPIGKFKIKDKEDNVVAEGKLEGAMILPEEVGEYISEEYVKLDKGEYEAIITFDYGEPKLAGKKVILPVDTFHDWKELKTPAKK